MENSRRMILAGDIGGTKTVLGLFSPGKIRPRLKALETYGSRHVDGLEPLVITFLEKHKAPISRACFGIAGPVEKGRVETTNLPWTVKSEAIKKRFGWKAVHLINDLVATAMSIPLLTSKEILPLNGVKETPGANKGLVAPGTGLGMAILVATKNGYVPVASEGGHADFGPNTPDDVALWTYLRKRFGHVSVERLLSGPGLVNIYQWLRDSGKYREPLWLRQRRTDIEPARAITEAAIHRRTPIALATLKTFSAVLGAVAGNLALTATTTGGIYLGGGIVPTMIRHLDQSVFNHAFSAKGRFKSFLKNIPVKGIVNDKAALLGAAAYALSR